jgi:hypothetical protein
MLPTLPRPFDHLQPWDMESNRESGLHLHVPSQTTAPCETLIPSTSYRVFWPVTLI